MAIKGCLHFTISVTDEARSERFYCDVLGLELVQRTSLGMVFLKAGDDHVILCRSKTPIDPNPGNSIMVHHAFQVGVDDYHDMLGRLRRNNIHILFEEDRQSGVFQGRQAYFHDPDRNVIEINALRHIATKGELGEENSTRPNFTHAPPV